MLAILGLGLVLRGSYLCEIRQAPDFDLPGVDAGFHDYWARGLAFGSWTPPEGEQDPHITETAYFRPPGYPYFLSFIYILFGKGYLAPRIVQMGLGLVNCLLAYVIGRRWFGRSVGLALATLMSSYWAFIYYESEFHDTVLSIFLMLSFVWALGKWAEKKSFLRALMAGALCGLCALVRPNVLLFLPAVALWFFWIAKKEGCARLVYSAVAGLVIGTFLTIAPATIRNYCVEKDFVLISSNGGINLFIGNNKDANGQVASEIPDLGKFMTCYDWPGIVRNLEKKLGKTLKSSEISDYFTSQAVHFIREHPIQFLKLTGQKILLFWGPYAVGHNKEDYFVRKFSPTLDHIPGGFAFTLALSVVGLFILVHDHRSHPSPSAEDRKKWTMAMLILALVGCYFLSILPFFVAGRYRVPIIPFLLLFDAYALVRIAQMLVAGFPRRAVYWLVALISLYALSSRSFADYTPSLSNWHYYWAVTYGQKGDKTAAMREYSKALAANPDDIESHYNLGLLLAEHGQLEQAVSHWSECLRINPEFAEGCYSLGLAMMNTGQIDQAISYFSRAVEIRPDLIEANYNLASLLTMKGKTDRAVPLFMQVIRLKPDFADAHARLALALAMRGQTDQAIRYHRQSLQLKGRVANDATVCFQLGSFLREKGRPHQALVFLRRAVEAAPDWPLALTTLARILATSPDPALRNAAESLRLAKMACEKTDFKVPELLDTLAAAYAESGQFDQAVKTAQTASQLATASGKNELSGQIQHRMAIYQKHQPCRE